MFLECFGVCAFVLTSTYSGSLLSFLAVTFEPKAIQEVKGLIHYEGNIASIFNYISWGFKETENPEYLALLPKTEAIGGSPEDMDRAVNRTGQGDLVLVDTGLTLEYHLRNKFVDE